MTTVLHVIAIVLILGCVIPATFGPAVYAGRPWRETSAGKAVMQLWIGLGLLVDLSVLFHFVPVPESALAWIRDVVYAYLLVALWRLFWTLLKARSSEHL